MIYKNKIDCKVIIIENNGHKNTFLNNYTYDVFYTNNNYLNTNNKGFKELKDIIDCINYFKIDDEDFIVKITGRYLLHDNSEFIQKLKENNYDCIIKYGSYLNPVNYKMNDCITGLIGMKSKYIKDIEFPSENECVEWKWAEITQKINNEKICIVNNLGINICPGSNKYFSV